MRSKRRPTCLLALALLGAFTVSTLTPAAAQEAPAAEQPAPGKKKKKPKAKPRRTAATQSSPASLEARHRECLAFIQRNGLSCDPWQQPTCGYDLGLYRPLSCVAP